MIKTVTIGDLGEIITGNTPPRSKPEYYGTFTPFIKATDISENEKYTYFPEEYYSEAGHQKYIKSLIPKGATCVVTIGSIGKKMTMAHCDCFINQAMNAIIPNDSYDKEYVYYLLRNNVHKLKSLDSGTASGRENVSKSAFSNMELQVIVEKEKQKRIGEILSAYDDLIENNQKQIKLLEEAAQRLYKEWFVDLRFPNYENTTVVDGVPEGWEKKTILDMSAVLRRGISPKYNESGKYTVINQKCIRQTIMDIKESRKQEKEYASDMNLKDSDIVICSTGSGTLGRVGQVFGDYPDTSFDSHVTLIRAKNAINVQFLFWALKNLQPLLMTLGQGSTNQLELPKRVIESYEIICPTDELIKDFQFIVQPIHDKITSLVEIIKNATEARDRLLPKLMSGELEV